MLENILLRAGIVLLILVFLARYAFFQINPKYVAIFDILGRRWRKAKEGPRLRIPFIEKARTYSIELERLEINGVRVMSKNMLELEIDGSLESVLDYDLLNRYDETRNQHLKAISDSIRDEIGVLAGTKEGELFIEEREVIRTIINCRLRLSVMPHRQNEYLEVEAAGGSIAPKDRIDFYKKYLKKIHDSLRLEADDPRRSHVEESYGIDVKLYNLTKVDFTADTKKAMEAKRQAELKGKAAHSEIDLAKAIEASKVSQESLNAAQVSLGKATKEVHSIEGLSGLSINLGGGK